MLDLGELIMILDLHRQGLSVSAISRRCGLDRKTVRKYIAEGLIVPGYAPRLPRPQVTDPYRDYLRERVQHFPGLSAVRLVREVRALGYGGGYTAVKDVVRQLRPPPAGFEHRFETPAGEQAQVDFAHFKVVFTSEPTTVRVVWLFAMVLGHSRYLWAMFVAHQDMHTVLRCHVAAFTALAGVPHTVLYDRMRTAVLGNDEQGEVVYNPALLDLARHYGFTPRACAAYRPHFPWFCPDPQRGWPDIT